MKCKIVVRLVFVVVLYLAAGLASQNTFTPNTGTHASGAGESGSQTDASNLFYPLAAAGTAIGFGAYVYLRKKETSFADGVVNGVKNTVDGFFGGWMNAAAGVSNFFEEKGDEVGGFFGGLVKGFGDVVSGIVGFVPAVYSAGKAIGADPGLLFRAETYTSLANAMIAPYRDDFEKDAWMGAGRVTGLIGTLLFGAKITRANSVSPKRFINRYFGDNPLPEQIRVANYISEASKNYGMPRARFEKYVNYVVVEDPNRFTLRKFESSYKDSTKRLLIEDGPAEKQFNHVKHEVAHVDAVSKGRALQPGSLADERVTDAFAYRNNPKYTPEYGFLFEEVSIDNVPIKQAPYVSAHSKLIVSGITTIDEAYPLIAVSPFTTHTLSK